MAWYWWILIGIAVIGLIAFKIWYVPKWLKKQAEKKAQKEKLLGDED